MRHPLVPVALLLSSVLARSAAGALPCASDLGTLVRVHASRDVIGRSIRLPPPPLHRDEELVVARGGATVVLRTDTLLCCGQTATRTFATGAATAADLTALNRALGESRVGTLQSCSIVNDLSGPVGVRFVGFYELEWYGRFDRRNAFTVEFADPGGSTLPACGPEVTRLVQAVAALTDAVAAAPGNRVCGGS